MNSILKKTSISIASVAMLLALAPHAFAATSLDVTVSGNGVKSKNSVKVSTKTVNKVVQTNVLGVSNAQSALSTTGGNIISGTTGDGKVKINSGDATSSNTATVTAGSNSSLVNTCGCDTGDTSVNISGNGVRSNTRVSLFNTNLNKTNQSSLTEVMVLQEALAGTGDNTIKNSTGPTVNKIVTGVATSDNTLVVESGNNVAGPVEIL